MGPEPEIEQSFPSSVEDKNGWSCASAFPYAFMLWAGNVYLFCISTNTNTNTKTNTNTNTNTNTRPVRWLLYDVALKLKSIISVNSENRWKWPWPILIEFECF